MFEHPLNSNANFQQCGNTIFLDVKSAHTKSMYGMKKLTHSRLRLCMQNSHTLRHTGTWDVGGGGKRGVKVDSKETLVLRS